MGSEGVRRIKQWVLVESDKRVGCNSTVIISCANAPALGGSGVGENGVLSR